MLRTETAMQELHTAWKGSRHDPAFTAKPFFATVLAKVNDGLARPAPPAR
ncbi:hypothetical protein [Allokutzneria sp. NRRL B-24872]|nr:hypothetical protein [Allokutzneria sp. NRRL B-24872]